ncbi:MAG: efflux RND transporter periplasmic adaptor subunit [Vicinamibacterales bacterium]
MIRCSRVAVLSCFLALLAAGCGPHASPEPSTGGALAMPAGGNGAVVFDPQSPMLERITRVPVRVMDLPTDEVIAAGKIEANPMHLSKLVMPVTGRIGKVLVALGESVRAGQPLFTVQSPDADAATQAYVSAQAALTQAVSAQTKAQADDDRESDLFAHNAVARKDVLATESALVQAKAAADQARAILEQATRRVKVLGLTPGDFQQEVVVTSPLSGKVLELTVVPGEYRTDQTVPVVTVADLSTVWVTSQVPESYIRFVQAGEHVAISLIAYPDETFEGTVSRIADTVDPQTRTVKVQAELDNRSSRFRPEMYGSIHHIESVAPVPVVPSGAVVQGDGRTLVYVESSPGHFDQREVTLGKPSGAVIRVLHGLTAGERVVADGTMLVKGMAGKRVGA